MKFFYYQSSDGMFKALHVGNVMCYYSTNRYKDKPPFILRNNFFKKYTEDNNIMFSFFNDKTDFFFYKKDYSKDEIHKELKRINFNKKFIEKLHV